jgi:hypothetical protein
MAVDVRNPYGGVIVADGGTPRIITVLAAANISGGYWVVGSGPSATVSSGADSFTASDVVGTVASANTVLGSNCLGLAIDDIASGTYGPVLQRGWVLLPAGSATVLGSVYTGCPVMARGFGNVIGSAEHGGTTDGGVVGRAITTSSGHAESYSIVSLNL